jgi:hypothetical protein
MSASSPGPLNAYGQYCTTIPSTQPEPRPGGRLQKPNAKVLETQQIPRGRATALRATTGGSSATTVTDAREDLVTNAVNLETQFALREKVAPKMSRLYPMDKNSLANIH